MTWQHNYEPVAGSLGLSALVAAIPILVLFFMLGVMRKPAWMAALERARSRRCSSRSLPTACRCQLAVISTLYGAAFGIFPIAWIVFSSIMLYRLAVDTGKFEIIKDSVGGLTNDRRLQAMFIAFSFGAFIEGAAGFGAPVAVSGAMLAGLGFNPFYAAGICLLANTAPVAFGSIGIPVITLANVTGLPVLALSAMVGTLCAMISVIIPGYLIVVMAGSTARARSAAGHPRVRAVVCRHAVLRLELHGARADRHPELAHLHRRDGARAQALEAEEHHASRGRQAGDGRRRSDTPAARSSWRGCRTCCWWSSCSSGASRRQGRRSTVDRRPASGVPADERRRRVERPEGARLHNLITRIPPVRPKPAPYAAVYELNWLSASGTACFLATHRRGACPAREARAVREHLRGHLQAAGSCRCSPSRACWDSPT